jgi:hypothetical protein
MPEDAVLSRTPRPVELGLLASLALLGTILLVMASPPGSSHPTEVEDSPPLAKSA